jgi:5-amino-6-(5-phospho-D-ribitylamino)uracil phosphatase
MIRLIAVDIDGTLLDSKGRLPPEHRDALAEVSARGVAIALASGRAFHFARPVAEALALPVTLIVNNGAVVKRPTGESVLKRLLPRAAAREVLTHVAGFEDSVAVVFDREPGDAASEILFERMDWTHPNRRRYYEKNQAYIGEVPALIDALTCDPIQVMVNGDVDAMRALATTLRRLPIAPEVSVSLTEYEERNFSLLDVNAAGCTKGSTLAAWAERCGLNRHEIMAVGDNLNDLEMLEFAGTAVVMDNASPAVKARGFALTGSHDEGGLASAIRRYAISD